MKKAVLMISVDTNAAFDRTKLFFHMFEAMDFGEKYIQYIQWYTFYIP